MRIAFLNHGRDAFPGGDAIALDATMDALRRRGHIADEVGWHAERLKDYDLCHMMHCNFSWSWGNYEAIKQAGKKYVLTPIYYPGPLLSGIDAGQLADIVGMSERVLPFSHKERGQMGLSLKHQPIPNGTDSLFHSGHAVFPATYDVLTVSARGDTDKNVGMVRAICQRLGVSFCCATNVPRWELADLYRYSRVFVNASGSERMSLTIGEALCSGCRVLATEENWGNEHYIGLVTFDPKDELRLELFIKWALSSPDWDYRPNAAARAITWDWVAEKLEAVYREVLDGPAAS